MKHGRTHGLNQRNNYGNVAETDQHKSAWKDDFSTNTDPGVLINMK